MVNIAAIHVDSVKTADKILTDRIVFDAILDVNETFNNTITQHPTEFNSNISDHVYNKNPIFTFTGIVTNASKFQSGGFAVTDNDANNAQNTAELNDWLTFFKNADQDLIDKVASSIDKQVQALDPNFAYDVDDIISKINERIDGFVSEKYSNISFQDPEIYDQTNRGSESRENRTYNPASTNNLVNSVGSNQRVQTAYDLLLSLYENPKPVKLLLKNRVYENCILSNLNLERNKENSDTLVARMTFEKIRVAAPTQTGTLFVTPENLDNLAPKDTSNNSPKVLTEEQKRQLEVATSVEQIRNPLL